MPLNVNSVENIYLSQKISQKMFTNAKWLNNFYCMQSVKMFIKNSLEFFIDAFNFFSWKRKTGILVPNVSNVSWRIFINILNCSI